MKIKIKTFSMCLHGSDTIHYDKKPNLGFPLKTLQKFLDWEQKILHWKNFQNKFTFGNYKLRSKILFHTTSTKYNALEMLEKRWSNGKTFYNIF